MNEKHALKVSGIFAVLAPLMIVAAIPFSPAVRGFGGPGPIDFGDARVLEQLSANQSAAIWVDIFALVGPTLALGAGFGWYLMLRRTSILALYGVLLWYVGMVFVVAQDALQLAFVTKIPAAYAAAGDASKATVLAVGDILAYTVEVLTFVGVVSHVGAFIVYLVSLRARSVPTWLAVSGLAASSVVIVSTVLTAFVPDAPMLGIGMPIGLLAGIFLFFAWGILMMRWKEHGDAV